MKIFDFLIICYLKLIKRHFKTDTLEISKCYSAISMLTFIILAWAASIFIMFDILFDTIHLSFVLSIIILLGYKLLDNIFKKIYIDKGRLDTILENNNSALNMSIASIKFMIYSLFIVPLIIMIGTIVMMHLFK